MIRLILTLIIILLSFPLAAQNPRNIVEDSFEEIAGTGLAVHTNPAGVRVFIDGEERGRTPVTFGNMPQGVYHIRLSREGYKDRDFNITLFTTSRLVASIKMEEERGGALVSVHRKPESSESLPFNPQIFFNALDDTSVPVFHEGKATLNLPVGYRTLRARAFGWDDVSVTVLINEDETTVVDIFMEPAAFRMENASQSRKRFNPLNPSNLGVTEFRFEVSAPGSGVIQILDSNEEEVYINYTDRFDTWVQHITWNGRDSNGKLLPEGIYTVLIKASPNFRRPFIGVPPDRIPPPMQEPEEVVILKLETEINYSTNIIPLSLKSGLSGLIFSPMPHVLPAGSYQFDAGIIPGSFSVPVNTQEINNTIVLPFQLNFRVSPFNRFELSASFNINSYLENQMQAGWGISGAAKYNIINTNPLFFAAGISYTWTANYGENPLTPGRGIGLHTPLSLELASFSITFCPSLFWHGHAEPIPSLHLSAGTLRRGNWVNTGLSMRYELDLKENSLSPRFLTGTEVHLFPPPSNFVFSVIGGMWTQEQRVGGFGGLKIGIIN